MQFAPGNDPFVITVGASDIGTRTSASDDTAAPWSAWGYTPDGFMKPEIAAPGRYMIAAVPTNGLLYSQRPASVTVARVHAAERHVVRSPGGSGCGGNAPGPASELDAGSGQGCTHALGLQAAAGHSRVSSVSAKSTSRRPVTCTCRARRTRTQRSSSSRARRRTAPGCSTRRPGLMQPGATRRGLMRPGATRRGLTQRGLTQHGPPQHGLTQHGRRRPGPQRPGATRPGATLRGLTRHGRTARLTTAPPPLTRRRSTRLHRHRRSQTSGSSIPTAIRPSPRASFRIRRYSRNERRFYRDDSERAPATGPVSPFREPPPGVEGMVRTGDASGPRPALRSSHGSAATSPCSATDKVRVPRPSGEAAVSAVPESAPPEILLDLPPHHDAHDEESAGPPARCPDLSRRARDRHARRRPASSTWPPRASSTTG